MSQYPNLLTPFELDNIFRNRILPRYSPQIKANSRPVCYILGGQPGSGKTTMIQSLVEESNDTPLIINGDDLRAFHPRMRDLLEHDDRNASDLVQADCNAWVGKLVRLCLENQTSFVVEGTMRNANAAINTAKEAKRNGFLVEAHVMSIPPRLSQASITARYEYQKILQAQEDLSNQQVIKKQWLGFPILCEISLHKFLFLTQFLSIHIMEYMIKY